MHFNLQKTMYIKVLFFCIKNVLKFTYSNVEFPNFPGEAEDSWTHLFLGRERKGGEGKEGALPWLQHPGL